MGGRFEVRQKEHKQALKQLEGVKYTKARRKKSLTEIHQSALTDHIASKNHMIDWEGARLRAKEPDWKKRGMKEAIFIRKAGTWSINRMGASPSSRSLLEAVVQ